MNCVRTRGWIAAAGLLLACASAQALPLDPIDWVSRRNGAEVCCGFNSTQTFRYDATSDLFTYSSVGTQTFRAGATEQLFSSAFTWNARIDEHGAVTDAGSMQWLADFGSGFEVLASGSISDIGFSAINPPDPSGDWTFLGLQVLMANSLPGATFDIGREFILNALVTLHNGIAIRCHFPIQNVVKIRPSKSSGVNSPVISARHCWAWRSSSAISSPARRSRS